MAHGQEAHASSFIRFIRNTAAIVTYGEDDVPALTSEVNTDALGLPMLQSVGNRFLGDPEELHGGFVVIQLNRIIIVEFAHDFIGACGVVREFLQRCHEAAGVENDRHEAT